MSIADKKINMTVERSVIVAALIGMLTWWVTTSMQGSVKTKSEFESDINTEVSLIKQEIKTFKVQYSTDTQMIQDQLKNIQAEKNAEFTKAEFEREKKLLEINVQNQIYQVRNELMEVQNRQYQEITKLLTDIKKSSGP